MSRRIVLLCAALAVVAVVGVGTVVVVRSADQSSSSDHAVSRRHRPPAGSIQQAIANAAAAGRIKVADRTGKVRGWIPYTARGGPAFASYPKGLMIPVTNDRGAIVGYELPSVGFVERSVVESPNFSVDKYVARHGL